MPQTLSPTAISASVDLEAGSPPETASARPLGSKAEVVHDEMGPVHKRQRREGGGHDETKNSEPDARGGEHVLVRVDVRQVISAPLLTRMKLRYTVFVMTDGGKRVVAVTLVTSASMRYASLGAGRTTNFVD